MTMYGLFDVSTSMYVNLMTIMNGMTQETLGVEIFYIVCLRDHDYVC